MLFGTYLYLGKKRLKIYTKGIHQIHKIVSDEGGEWNTEVNK